MLGEACRFRNASDDLRETTRRLGLPDSRAITPSASKSPMQPTSRDSENPALPNGTIAMPARRSTACESAVGLGILIVIYRFGHSVNFSAYQHLGG